MGSKKSVSEGLGVRDLKMWGRFRLLPLVDLPKPLSDTTLNYKYTPHTPQASNSEKSLNA
jgi:hypothetical protein